MKGNNNMSKIQWTNKISGETGYVKAFSRQMGHFENTYDIDEAKEYKTEAAAKTAIRGLEAVGEADNNIFEIV